MPINIFKQENRALENLNSTIDTNSRWRIQWGSDTYKVWLRYEENKDFTANEAPHWQLIGLAELDRKDVNNLIKDLRRARDAAFGRDE